MPRNSRAVLIVFAVNWPPQAPGTGQDASSISRSSSRLIFPARYAPIASNTVTTVASRRPRSTPGLIVPLYRARPGRSRRASAIAAPGSVLSQPTRHTRPSKRCPRATSSIESAITSRDTSEAFIPSVPIETPSETEIVLNSIGVPPAARIPSLTFTRQLALVVVARHRLDPGRADADDRLREILVGEADGLEHGACGRAIGAVEQHARVLARVVRGGLAHGPDYRRRVEPNGWAARPMAPLDASTSVAGTDEHTRFPKTIVEKIWDDHVVAPGTDGAPDVIGIDLHLVHEVTSPQAFDGLRERGLPVRRPGQTVATVDHSIPTTDRILPIVDEIAARQVARMEENARDFGIPLHGIGSPHQGIVHVIGPELGLTQPGMTIVCGDSHTATHGAFGALAFGIGTTEVEHVLATQALLQRRPKTFEVRVDGRLHPGVTAKDIILSLLSRIGIGGANGHVFEYRGSAIRAIGMEGRMTICNMSIEGGARAGLVAPDDTTFEYVAGRPHAPVGRRLGSGRRATGASSQPTTGPNSIGRSPSMRPSSRRW